MLAGNLQETVHAQNDEQMDTAYESEDNQETTELEDVMFVDSVSDGLASAQVVLGNNGHDDRPVETGLVHGVNRGGMYSEFAISERPRVRYQWVSRKEFWFWGLISSDFFHPCGKHKDCKRNECKFYSLLRCQKGEFEFAILCKHCMDEGAPIEMCFQIRRYMYQNVIHWEDLNTIYDPRGIQAYTINAKQAVLISPKILPAQAHVLPAFDHSCQSCRVPLRHDCTFCSLHCKIWSEMNDDLHNTMQNMSLSSGTSDLGLVRAEIFEPKARVRSSSAKHSRDNHHHHDSSLHHHQSTQMCDLENVDTTSRRKNSQPVRSPEF
eukprot:jgi/Picsp_1/2217/NSC_05681-R1_zinc-binding protein